MVGKALFANWLTLNSRGLRGPTQLVISPENGLISCHECLVSFREWILVGAIYCRPRGLGINMSSRHYRMVMFIRRKGGIDNGGIYGTSPGKIGSHLSWSKTVKDKVWNEEYVIIPHSSALRRHFPYGPCGLGRRCCSSLQPILRESLLIYLGNGYALVWLVECWMQSIWQMHLKGTSTKTNRTQSWQSTRKFAETFLRNIQIHGPKEIVHFGSRDNDQWPFYASGQKMLVRVRRLDRHLLTGLKFWESIYGIIS